MGMLSVDGRNHVVCHVITPWFLGAPKSCAFREILKMYLIDSAQWVELDWVSSCAEVTWVTRSNQRLLGGGKQWREMVKVMGLMWGLLREPNIGVNWWIRLKANKCYQELLCYLSFYYLLVLDPCLGLWPLRRCYQQCKRYYHRLCPDYIAGHIALIALTVLLICIALIVSVLTIYFSMSKRSKTQLISPLNHALTSDHSPGSICINPAGSSRHF